jgi:hypothetical protein
VVNVWLERRGGTRDGGRVHAVVPMVRRMADGRVGCVGTEEHVVLIVCIV